jgi:hypothetical protein
MRRHTLDDSRKRFPMTLCLSTTFDPFVSVNLKLVVHASDELPSFLFDRF